MIGGHTVPADSTIDYVSGPVTRTKPIVSRTAGDPIPSRPSVENVVAGEAKESIVTFPAVDAVIRGGATQYVVSLRTVDRLRQSGQAESEDDEPKR